MTIEPTDTIHVADKKQLLAAIARLPSDRPSRIIFPHGGRWTFPQTDDKRRAQLAKTVNGTRGRHLFSEDKPDPKPTKTKPATGWKTSFTEMIADGEHESALGLAEMHGTVFFGKVNRGWALYLVVEDLAPGFILCAGLTDSGYHALGSESALRAVHALDAAQCRAAFENVREKALTAAARAAAKPQTELRAQFLAAGAVFA